MTEWIKKTVNTYDGYTDCERERELWMVTPPKPVHRCAEPNEYVENPNEGEGPELVRLRERTYWMCPECGTWWWYHPTGGIFDRPAWYIAPEKRYRIFNRDSNQAYDDIQELMASQEET